jgi:hypothetical protein
VTFNFCTDTYFCGRSFSEKAKESSRPSTLDDIAPPIFKLNIILSINTKLQSECWRKEKSGPLEIKDWARRNRNK